MSLVQTSFRLPLCCLIGLSLLSLSACSSSEDVLVSAPSKSALTQAPVWVDIITDMGTMTVELNPSAAPKTVANFLSYVDDGFYDQLIFHRVIVGFMIQGGGFNEDLQRQRTQPAILNESDNGLSNQRGSIAMARTQDPNSATTQFYINLTDNLGLDARGRQPGYAVFGRLSSGFDVLDAIGAVNTHSQGGMADVPVNPVSMEIRRREAP